MLNRFQSVRERGWTQIDAQTYEHTWQRYGGSVATHPQVVERLAAFAGIPVRYLAWEQGSDVKAAIATWGRSLALSKDVLKSHGKKGLFDLGNAELILPIAADAQVPLRHRGRYLSALNQGRVSTLKPQTESLAMARTPEELSKKFRYNQRRELRLLEEAGGVVRPVSDFSSTQLAEIYCDLFARRWGFPATGAERMAEVVELLRDLLIGSVIFLNDAAIAIQERLLEQHSGEETHVNNLAESQANLGMLLDQVGDTQGAERRLRAAITLLASIPKPQSSAAGELCRM